MVDWIETLSQLCTILYSQVKRHEPARLLHGELETALRDETRKAKSFLMHLHDVQGIMANDQYAKLRFANLIGDRRSKALHTACLNHGIHVSNSG